jgi:hypothetical protein
MPTAKAPAQAKAHFGRGNCDHDNAASSNV